MNQLIASLGGGGRQRSLRAWPKMKNKMSMPVRNKADTPLDVARGLLRLPPKPGKTVVTEADLMRSSTRHLEIDFKRRALKMDVKITRAESEQMTERMLQRLRASSKGTKKEKEGIIVTRDNFQKYIRERNHIELEREAMLEAIEQPAEATETTRQLIPAIGIIGTISWAITGTQLAGEQGMNIFGCGFVGCVSALGGGTLNNLIFGVAKNGVQWVKNPQSTVMVALAASFVTFFVWPNICTVLTEKRLHDIHEAAQDQSDFFAKAFENFVGNKPQGVPGITKKQFLAACAKPELYDDLHRLLLPQMRRKAVPPSKVCTITSKPQYSPEQLFAYLDADGNGTLNISELRKLIMLEVDGSGLRYTLDSIALGCSSVTGTAMAMSRGLHPVVCVVSSVTMCFGGILRDLVCNRDISLGSQSFAGSLVAGSSMYVFLREMGLRGVMMLPLSARILLSAASAVSVRAADFFTAQDLLPSMYDRKDKPARSWTSAARS